MKNKTFFFSLSTIIFISFFSCKSHKNVETGVVSNLRPAEGVVRVIAPVIIYKTNADFYSNVPVILNDEKTDIVSYPDVKDVFYNGQLAYPTRLENGYLLDNRGIAKNVAFLKYTYEAYSKLQSTPSKEQLMDMIISKDPLRELYNCHKFQKKNIQMINETIKNGLPNVCENLIK
ncbi:MAG: hypothetical protein ACOYO1_16440 [Bacteroidales bacterium]